MRPSGAAIALGTEISALTAIGNDMAVEALFARRIEALGGPGELAGLADPLLSVPATATARIQEMHITLGHALCDGLERGLGMV